MFTSAQSTEGTDMLRIELDTEQPGVSERSHEILTNITEQIVTALELGQSQGNVIIEQDGKDVVAGTWRWE